MFFPYRDDNPQILVPYVTYGILVVNVLIFLYQSLLPGPIAQHAFALRYGIIPAHLWGGDTLSILAYNQELLSEIYIHLNASSLMDVQLLPGALTIITSTFLHGGWFHIIGNMLFLYVFADNIEGALGHRQFALFYLLAALASGLLQAAVLPESQVVVVGASGAIAGVLGGYLVRYPKARVHVLVFLVFFVTTIRLPAAVVLGFWFLMQAISGLGSLSDPASGGVAWFGHIGGFLAGFSYMGITRLGRKFTFKHD